MPTDILVPRLAQDDAQTSAGPRVAKHMRPMCSSTYTTKPNVLYLVVSTMWLGGEGWHFDMYDISAPLSKVLSVLWTAPCTIDYYELCSLYRYLRSLWHPL